MTYFIPIGVIKDRITKMYHKYLNGKLWPYQLPCFINCFSYDPANKAWLFEDFICELEAAYSFKINCILKRQVISLNKNSSLISKNYNSISWSPICTPLIQSNTDIWCEHMAGLFNIYLYGCVSPLVPECAVYLCLYVCETHGKVILVLRYQGWTIIDP